MAGVPDPDPTRAWAAVPPPSKCFDAFDYNYLDPDERACVLEWLLDHGFEPHLVRFVRYEEGHLTLGLIRNEPRFWIDEVEVTPTDVFPWPTTNRIRLQAHRR